MPNELGRLLVNRMPLLLLVAMVGGAVAYLMSFAVHPVYRASVLLAAAESDSSMSGVGAGLTGLQSITSIMGINSRSDSVDKAIAVMRSRRFCETVTGSAAEAAVLEEEWRARNRFSALIAGRSSSLSEAERCEFFRTDVFQTSVDPKTGFVAVSVRSIDRDRAAQWANGLVQQINAEMQAKAISDARQTLKHLDAEIARTVSVEVRQAIAKAMELQVQRAAFAATQNSFVFSVLDPAAVPDQGRFESPHRMLLAGAGALVVLFITSAVLVLRHES